MKIITLERDTLQKIVEKTINQIITIQEVEETDSSIKTATEKTCEFVRKQTTIELYKKNIHLRFAKKHIQENNILYNLNKIQTIMKQAQLKWKMQI